MSHPSAINTRRASTLRVSPANSIDWARIARLVLSSRALDDLEERELVPAGKVRYQFSARGHELAQVLLASHLTHPHDGVAVYYRSRPLMLTLGLSLAEALAGSMARATGTSGGRDIGVVFNMPSRGGATVLPMTGDVGGQYGPAAGWAQAIGYHTGVCGNAAWRGAIAVVLGGDGSVATPGFWGALNTATTLRLPLLFVIEDNGYAISVPGTLQVPGGNIAANLSSYTGLHILEGDGTDPQIAADLTSRAVAFVRGGGGPALLRLSVPRLNGHSLSDTQSYKSTSEQQAEWQRDPLAHLRAFLLDRDWTPDDWELLLADVQHALRQALAEAEAAPAPPSGSACRGVFAEAGDQRPATNEDGRRKTEDGADDDRRLSPIPITQSTLGNLQSAICNLQSLDGPRINLIDAVRQTLISELHNDPRRLLFGEDVGRKGGVHGATRDLQHEFGPERVFDTLLNEEAIIGRAVGLALAGLRPVPEIQFRKYADPAMEQIVDCGGLRWRTAGNFSAPLVVRMPVGFSKYSGDPWHSVSGEAIYAHTIGWKVAMPSNAADAVGLLRTALRGDDPVLFLEHRALLDTAEGRRPYPGDGYMLPFGQAALVTTGDMLTLVSWGALLHRCRAACEGITGVELIDLRTLVPWDRAAVLESVRKTGRCLVVHEDTWTCGFGAEVAATVAHEAFSWLDAPVMRLASPDCPVPYNAGLAAEVIPSVAAIRARVEELLRF